MKQQALEDLLAVIERDPSLLSVLQDLWVYEKYQGVPGPDMLPVWQQRDVADICPPVRYRKLRDVGVILEVGGKRGNRLCRLKDAEAVEMALKLHTVVQPCRAGEDLDEDLPEDFLHAVVGYDDIKYWVRKAVRKRLAGTPCRNHFLWIGDSALGKSVWFYEIRRLPSVYATTGSTASKAGIVKVLFDLQPAFLIVDEADKLPEADLSALLEVMESGEVTETKVRGDAVGRRFQLDPLVFLACNDGDRIPKELRSRVMGRGYELHPYSYEEFIEVCERILPRRFGTSVEVARRIGEEVFNLDLDVREAVRAAEMCDDEEEIQLFFDTIRRRRDGGDLS